MSTALKARLIGTALPLAFLLIFVIQNIEMIHVKFLFWDLSMPRSIMIFLVLLIGIVIGVVFRSTIIGSVERRLKPVKSEKS